MRTQFKFLGFIVLVFFTLVGFTGCKIPSGHSKSDNNSGAAKNGIRPNFVNMTSGVSANKVGISTKAVQRKGLSASQAPYYTPGTVYSDFTIGENFDPYHMVAVVLYINVETEITGELSQPPFNGFVSEVVNDGQTYTSTYLGRVVTSVASLSQDGATETFNGTYNDGGGSYTLAIDLNAKTFTFTQRLIFDSIYEECDNGRVQLIGGAVVHLCRHVIYLTTNGSYDANGNITGTGKIIVMPFDYDANPAGVWTSNQLQYYIENPTEINPDDIATMMHNDPSQTSYPSTNQWLDFGMFGSNFIVFLFKGSSTKDFYAIKEDDSWYGGGSVIIANDIRNTLSSYIDLPGQTPHILYSNSGMWRIIDSLMGEYSTPEDPSNYPYVLQSDFACENPPKGCSNFAGTNTHFIVWEQGGNDFQALGLGSESGGNDNAVQAEWNSLTF